jgi:hypothetical protein
VDDIQAARKQPGWRAGLTKFRPLRGTFLALLAIDAALLLANALYYLAHNGYGNTLLGGVFRAQLWDGARDESLIEWVGYVQMGSAAILLLALAMNRKSALYFAWSLVFLVLMLDDSLRLHENVGHFLANTVHLPSVLGLRPNDLGELCSWAFFGIVLGAVLVVTHLRSSKEARHDSWVFFGLTVFLACFAVVLDMLEVEVWGLLPLIGHGAITLAETGGELVAMTFILSRVLFVARQHGFAVIPRMSRSSTLPRTRTSGW